MKSQYSTHPMSTCKVKKCISGQNRVQPAAVRVNQPGRPSWITNRSQLVKLQSAALPLLSFPCRPPIPVPPLCTAKLPPPIGCFKPCKKWDPWLFKTWVVWPLAQPGSAWEICVARVFILIVVWPLNYFFSVPHSPAVFLICDQGFDWLEKHEIIKTISLSCFSPLQKQR